MYDSRDFVVVVAKPGDTAEGLAARYLGDPKKKWMIEDYMGARTFSEGQEVVIPKREWNPVGVFPWRIRESCLSGCAVSRPRCAPCMRRDSMR